LTIGEGYRRLFSPYFGEITRKMPLLRQPVMTLAFFARLLREPAHAPPTAIAWAHGTRTLRVGNSLQETRAIMMVTGTPRGPSQRQTRTHEIFAGQRSPGRLTHCAPRWVNMSSVHAALAAPHIPPYTSCPHHASLRTHGASVFPLHCLHARCTARLQTPAATRRSDDTPNARGDGAHLA
jgi:hypothetical protein